MPLFSRASFLGLLCWLLSPLLVLAHDPGLSHATVQVAPDKILVKLTFAPSDLGANSQDPLKLQELAKRAFLWIHGTQPVAPLVANARTAGADTEIVLEYPRQTAKFQFQLFPELPFGHRQFLSIQSGSGKTLRESMVSAHSTAGEITEADLGENGTAQGEAGPSTVAGFFKMGVGHILTGYDHLLFLLGLLVVCRSLAPALVCITCFTLAHSITLAASVLGWFSLPSHIVEPLIAASILYIGIEIYFLSFHLGRRAALTFAFGLIHGMGFAGALQELGIAQRPGGVLAPLLGFNLGVEAGQIAITILVLPLLLAMQRKESFRRYAVPALSTLIAVAGAFWLVQRTLF